METTRTAWQGYAILAIGFFFIVVTFVLYGLGKISSSRLLIYDGVSVLVVVLGVVYVVFSRRLLRQTKLRGSK